MNTSFHAWTLAFVVILFAAFSAVPANGQSNRGKRGPNYDPKTETTINGVIQEVKDVPGPRGRTGTHLVVKAGEDVYDVHVGPTWYLTQEKYAFTKGDQVEVTGSRVSYQGGQAIVARQIKKDGKTWTLRDKQGIPLWSRRKNS